MRVGLLANGDLDELAVEGCTVQLERTGAARYRLCVVSEERTFEVVLWTTHKGRMRVRLQDPEIPGWASVAMNEEGDVESVHAADCAVHLENMDRAHSWIGVHRGTESVSVDLVSRGYVRARLVAAAGER